MLVVVDDLVGLSSINVSRLLGGRLIWCPYFDGVPIWVICEARLVYHRLGIDELKRFFVGVCREAESRGRALDLGDLVSPDSVLRRLSEELFDLVFPALDTWRVVKGLMATERNSWRRYQIPEDVVLRIPESDEVACSSKYGDVAFYEADFNAGVRFPLQPLMRELLDRLNLSPGQLASNAWRTVVGCMVMWKVLSKGEDDLTVDELLFCYKPCQIPASPGFWSLNMRQKGLKLVVGTPSSNREWKDDFVFVCGDNWESLPCEKDDDFIPVHREWGRAFVFWALKRPKLNQDSHNRVLRALHHDVHHFKHFIRPELLALYSFGPEPSEAMLSLQEINQKRMATAKLNREKLRKMMSQQDEALLTLGKKRRTNSSSKKVTDERVLPPPPVQKPSLPDPAPTSSIEVIEVPNEPSSSRSVEKVPTLPRDASFACHRAKSVVTKDDIGEYDKVNTDVIKVAGVHSLMKGLTELTVIANRCLQWEEALMKHKVEMAVKKDELKKETAGRRNADERLERLTSQMESIKVSAVEEFKSSEAYDDNNTKYFLAGFSLLKRQAKEKYPDLDFEAFQSFEDDESVMPVEEVDGRTTSADPQLDDDAAS
uniref:Uncharacterized protein n=1 Tax=Fagus sylvatica TaxID=28930 RepID=A0A2N9JBV7_FAGSY